MDPGTTDRGLRDAGVTSVQFLLASVLALLVFLALANVVVVQYARGSLRSALDQGVRAGAIHQSTSACEARIAAVIGELLGGEIGERAGYECSVSGGLMTARATATIESWTIFASDYDIEIGAEAVIETNGS